MAFTIRIYITNLPSQIELSWEVITKLTITITSRSTESFILTYSDIRDVYLTQIEINFKHLNLISSYLTSFSVILEATGHQKRIVSRKIYFSVTPGHTFELIMQWSRRFCSEIAHNSVLALGSAKKRVLSVLWTLLR